MGATPAEQTKSLLGREKPVDVQPGSVWLWLALLVASVFRQWAYSVLASLYALSPSDYDDKTSVRGATSLSSDEYAGIVYAYTIVAVTAMGASGACTTLFGARRTAVAGLGLQVAGCVTCGLSYGVVSSRRARSCSRAASASSSRPRTRWSSASSGPARGACSRRRRCRPRATSAPPRRR